MGWQRLAVILKSKTPQQTTSDSMFSSNSLDGLRLLLFVGQASFNKRAVDEGGFASPVTEMLEPNYDHRRNIVSDPRKWF